MKYFQFGVVATMLHCIGLIAFILVARTNFAVIGKPAVIGFAVIGAVFLLWQRIQNANGRMDLCLLPALLALGYITAFHLTGMLGFHGLLRDSEFSFGYYVSVLRVTVIVFALYAMCTVFLVQINRWLRG